MGIEKQAREEMKYQEFIEKCIVKIKTPHQQGTGFFILPDGLILTCFHVIKNTKAELISIEWDKTMFSVEISQQEPDQDIALIKVVGSNTEFPFVHLTKYDGEFNKKFYTYGFPYGNLGFSGYPSSGYITGLANFRNRRLIVLRDADIDSGLSGSPLLLDDGNGYVLGVICADLKYFEKIQEIKLDVDDLEVNPQLSVYLEQDKKIGFAIPVNTVFNLYPQIATRNDYYYQKQTLHPISPGEKRDDSNLLLEMEHYKDLLQEKKENLFMIEERISKYVLSTEIPLTLEKEKRILEKDIRELEKVIISFSSQ